MGGNNGAYRRRPYIFQGFEPREYKTGRCIGAVEGDGLQLVAEWCSANGAISKFDTEFLLEFHPGGCKVVLFAKPEVAGAGVTSQQR